jgi:nitrous oxide reductase accessory protein NosL
MRTDRRPTRRLVFAGLALALAVVGCGRQAGPPAIARGAPCATCGMSIEDLRFAGELRLGGAWKAYDDLACLLRDARTDAAAPAWLMDQDTGTLHAADSMWVVKGDFPTPMSGGMAAFLDRAAADEVARQTNGSVERFATVRAAGSAR